MKKVLAIIVSIILTLSIACDGIYLAITNSISEKTIKKNIKTNLLNSNNLEEINYKDEILKTLPQTSSVDEETINKLLESPTVEQNLTELANSVYNYNLTGDESAKYTENQIIDLVEKDLDKILAEIDYEATAEEKQQAIDYIKTNSETLIEKIYSIDINELESKNLDLDSLNLEKVTLEE